MTSDIHFKFHDSITKMQGLVRLLILLGGRTIGKTHAVAIYLVTHEGKTLWIRRKKDELGVCATTFMDYIKRENESRLSHGR